MFKTIRNDMLLYNFVGVIENALCQSLKGEFNEIRNNNS